MKYIDVEQMNEACTHEYNKNYAHDDYCHEQSFIWGFQEGVEFCENEMIDKACDIFNKILCEISIDIATQGVSKKDWKNIFRKRFEE